MCLLTVGFCNFYFSWKNTYHAVGLVMISEIHRSGYLCFSKLDFGGWNCGGKWESKPLWNHICDYWIKEICYTAVYLNIENTHWFVVRNTIHQDYCYHCIMAIQHKLWNEKGCSWRCSYAFKIQSWVQLFSHNFKQNKKSLCADTEDAEMANVFVFGLITVMEHYKKEILRKNAEQTRYFLIRLIWLPELLT